jgi:RNA polymerase primary sigma factor
MSSLRYTPPRESVQDDLLSESDTTYRSSRAPARDRKQRDQSVEAAWSQTQLTRGEESVLQERHRLTADDECALAARIKTGDSAARERLIIANLALVLRAVRDFRQPGIPLDDLIQEGNLGLIQAAQRYDPATHSTRFATYAACWIRASLIRAVTANGSLIQIPEQSQLLRLRYRGMPIESHRQRGDKDDVSDRKPASRENVSRHLDVPVERVKSAQFMGDDRSLRAAFDELLVAREEPPDQDLANEEDRSHVHMAIRRLSPFEAWIIRERFGLGEPARGRLAPSPTKTGAGDSDVELSAPDRTVSQTALEPQATPPTRRGFLFQRSYVELGQDCGLSAHRVQQVERTALEKLRRILAPRFADVVNR